MAKRGCWPPSSKTTERPNRLAIIAINEPPNPEPTIAMSKSVAIPACSTPDNWLHLLRKIHIAQPAHAVRKTVSAIRESLQIPKVSKDPPASQPNSIRAGLLQRGEPGRGEFFPPPPRATQRRSPPRPRD